MLTWITIQQQWGKSAVGEQTMSTAPLSRCFVHRVMGRTAVATSPSEVSCEA
jgi:hypothetical protein